MKAVVVKDPLATIMTTPVNLTSMIDDMLNCGEISAAGRSGRELDFQGRYSKRNIMSKISRSQVIYRRIISAAPSFC